MQHEAVRKKI